MMEEQADKVTIISWSGDLDRAYPVVILATTAAAAGMEVTIFSTFWGLLLLKKKERGVTGTDWMTKMLSLMEPGGPVKLPLSKLNMGGMGPWMMKKIFVKNNIPPLEEFWKMAVDLGIKILPCQMTMDAFGLKRDDLIDGIGEPVGAATAIAEAAAAKINWFI